MDRRYFGIKEMANYLGIAEGTLYSWVCYRKIPFFKVGRLVKFDMVIIDEWIQKTRSK